MSQATPRIVQTNIDTRRNLETLLRTHCDSFILNVTRLALDPIMNVLRRENSAHTEKLSAFTTVKETLPSVVGNFNSKLPEYLTNANTLQNLKNAVTHNMLEVYSQFYNQMEDKSEIWSIEEFTKIIETVEQPE
jgi:hypothetical protein